MEDMVVTFPSSFRMNFESIGGNLSRKFSWAQRGTGLGGGFPIVMTPSTGGLVIAAFEVLGRGSGLKVLSRAC